MEGKEGSFQSVERCYAASGPRLSMGLMEMMTTGTTLPSRSSQLRGHYSKLFSTQSGKLSRNTVWNVLG